MILGKIAHLHASRTFKMLWLMVAVMCLSALWSSHAFADETTKSKEPGELKCSGDAFGGGAKDCNCRERHQGYLLSVIVPCIRDEVITVTKRITGEFAPYLQGTTMAFLIFVLTLFGVKILMAEGDPKKDTFILLLKIAVVIGFLASYDELIIDPSFAIMQEGVEITTSAFEGTTVNEKCQPYLDKYPDAEKPWIHYDCIIGQLFGFGGDVFVGASALGVVSVALFSGQFGSAIFLSAVAALFFILKLVIRGCYSYLMAVFAMAVLLFISPLLIPLIWMPITQQYFDRWLGALMAMMVIPAIVMAYLTMSFIILDRVFFDEEMGIATLLSKEKIEKMRMAPQCSNTTVAGSPATNNITNKQAESDSHFNWNNPLLSANASTGLFNCLYTIDFRSDEAGTINKLFFAFVVLSLVTYILMLMLNAIISMAQLMMGGGYFMQSAVMGEDGEGNVFERTLSNTQSSMNKSLSGASSANDFVGGVAKGIAGIPRDIANAFGGKKS